MTDPMLGHTQVLIAARVLIEQVMWEVWNFAAVDWNDFVFVIEEFDVLSTPATVLGAKGEENELAITINVKFDLLLLEALGNGGLVSDVNQ